MLNISGINNGVVLDHIQAGKSMDIYHYLNLQELDCQVAIIKNAKSSNGPQGYHQDRGQLRSA